MIDTVNPSFWGYLIFWTTNGRPYNRILNLLPGDGVTQWKASDYVMTYERTVEAVDKTAKTVTVDTGIPLTLDKKYYSVTVQRITDDDARVTESGVENIRKQDEE